MLTQPYQQNNVTNATLNSEETRAKLLARVYNLILSWPCPSCGQPFPCLHDAKSEVTSEAVDEKRKETAQVKA